MSALGQPTEPTLHARPAAALAVASVLGLHLPAIPAAAKPAAESVAAPTPPPDLPAWLTPSRHAERVVAAAQPVQLAAITQPAPPLRAERRGRPPLPQPVETYGRPSGSVAAVVAYAKAQVGRGYRLGTAGPTLFDCSGLTMAAYARAGVRLPHKAAAQRRHGRAVARHELQPGDLVFWGDTYHVAIYIGGGEVIAATTPRGGVKRQRIWGHPSAYRRLVG